MVSKHTERTKAKQAAWLSMHPCTDCGTTENTYLARAEFWWKPASMYTAFNGTLADKKRVQEEGIVLCARCRDIRIKQIRVHLENPVESAVCIETYCSRRTVGRGYCRNHYYRYMKLTGITPRSQAVRGQGTITEDGYRRVSDKEYGSKGSGTILEHRLVMSRHLGRALRPEEEVHHKNGNRLDNQLANLELWVHSQPSGQRVVDLVEWASEILSTYEKEVDKLEFRSASPPSAVGADDRRGVHI